MYFPTVMVAKLENWMRSQLQLSNRKISAVARPSDSWIQLTDIINKYKSHPSIKKIKSNYTIKQKFSFKPVTVKDIENVIKNIPTNKVRGGEIPLNV